MQTTTAGEGRDAGVLAGARVVLVEPTHAGNIGSAARAMKTMGLSDLRIVGGPALTAEARANAANACDVLDAAQRCGSLVEALHGAGLVMGLTARQRRRSAPALAARQAAELALAELGRHPVAVVFGREHSGLTNDELGRCHHTVHIPANPGYPALNLAAAVQVVCYELYAGAAGANVAAPRQASAGTDHLEAFYRHLAEVIEQAGYEDAAGMPRLMRRLRRLFNRARPEVAELNILRGVLVAVQRRLDKGGRHTQDAGE